MRADTIIRSLQNRFSDHACFTQVKDGPSSRGFRQMDFVAIQKTWTPVTIKAFEVKVSHSDFVADTKWPNYMKLCNSFYWVCPEHIIKKEEIDARAGLIYVYNKTLKCRTVKRAVYMDNEPDPYLLLYLIFWKIFPDRYDFDKTRRARMESIRTEMRVRKELGDRYAEFVSKTLNTANKRLCKEQAELQEHNAYVGKILEWFEQNDMTPYQVETVLDKAKLIPNIGHIKSDMAKLVADLQKILSVI